MSKGPVNLEGVKSEKFSSGFRAGGFIFTSGQVGRDLGTGKAGSDVQEQTKIALNNIKQILEAAGASVEDVIKVTVFLKDMADYEKMNEVYVSFFREPRPARSCVEANLALEEFRVEIEAVAHKER